MIHRSYRQLAVIVCVLSTAGVLTAFAQERSPGGPPPERGPGQTPPGAGRGPGGQGGPGGRGQSVEGSMKGMNRALNQLGVQLADGSKIEENLALINDMERGCVAAKGMPIPADLLAEVKDDAAKAALAKAYRGHLFKALRMMVDIESDIIDGKNDAAKAKLDALAEYRNTTHKELGLKDE